MRALFDLPMGKCFERLMIYGAALERRNHRSD
jgi:hypothetical protein